MHTFHGRYYTPEACTINDRMAFSVKKGEPPQDSPLVVADDTFRYVFLFQDFPVADFLHDIGNKVQLVGIRVNNRKQIRVGCCDFITEPAFNVLVDNVRFNVLIPLILA